MQKRFFPLIVLFTYWTLAGAYPLDAEPDTGILRLEGYRLAQEGKAYATAIPSGALLKQAQIRLRLTENPTLDIPDADPEFTRQIVDLLGKQSERFGIAVLDLSDPQQPRYAEHRGNIPFNPGSVGKLAVVTAMFNALATTYPDALDRRRQVLHDTQITADRFINYDHHKVPIWRSHYKYMQYEKLKIGDTDNLWTYLDWMMSASSNAAASMVMKNLILLHRFGSQYPVDEAASARYFQASSPLALGQQLGSAIREGLTASGIDYELFRQGNFFTAEGKRRVSGTNSTATPRELMRYLLHLEQGKVVDAFSSLEIKKLLYMTEKRIRYASSPALENAAVYFKSGSMYRCRPEAGFTCGKYRGNVVNVLNSVAIIEAPAGDDPSLFYLVVVTSNVLKENAAVTHQTLATRIHRLLEKRHLVRSLVKNQVVHGDD